MKQTTNDETYKTPKRAMIRNSVELSTIADSIADLIEGGRYAKAIDLLENDLTQLVETLQAQLQTHNQ